MSKKITILVPIILMTAMLSISCANSQNEVIVDNCGSDVHLQTKNFLVVRLKSQMTAGYVWISEPPKESIVTSTGEPTIERKPSDLDGGSEIQIFRFQALRPGSTTLSFRYLRPWQTDQPPLQTCNISVTVEK